MKRQMIFATAFSAALAVSVAAQTGTPPAGAQTGSPQQERQSSQQVTMTGCLQQASSGVAGTAGAATASSSEKQFVLANATPEGGAASATAGTSGTPGAASSSSMGNRFRLVGGDRKDLEKYLNSKVEIRGTLEKSGYSAPGAAATAAAPGTPEQSKADDKLPILRVTSVKQIAETCAGGN